MILDFKSSVNGYVNGVCPHGNETNFLSIVQWGPRKNVEQLIETFLQTFKDDPDVGLILKTNRTADHHIDRESVTDVLKSFRKSFPDAKCKLYLLHGTLTSGQLKSVYTNPKVKAFVTATHGEGYGLPLFEAACNDLPVIATNWSGHLDFLDPFHYEYKYKLYIHY